MASKLEITIPLLGTSSDGVTRLLGLQPQRLAVIAFPRNAIERCYSLPTEALPEGIEFSSYGKRLVFGSTLANHIAVYAVEGMVLERSPFVTPVGEGHAVLGIKRSQISRGASPSKIAPIVQLYFGILAGHSLTEGERDLGSGVASPVLKVSTLLLVSERLMQGL